MDQKKVSLLGFPLIGIICILLAINVGTTTSKLNSQKARTMSLDAQVSSLVAQVSSLDAQLAEMKLKYDEQVKLVKDLQYSLDIARREADSLKQANADLEAKVGAAAKALNRAPETVTQ